MTEELKDSGTRREFGSGAVRDAEQGKGRYDLVPPFAVRAIALQMERGARKYSARNWEKGMPLAQFLNSCERHLQQLKAGFDDEPHADAVIWNIACFIETRERLRRGLLPAELDDMPKTYAGREVNVEAAREGDPRITWSPTAGVSPGGAAKAGD